MAISTPFGPSVRLHKLLVAAAVVVPALTFVAAAWQNRADVLAEAAETVERTAAVLHEHARKVFETQELVLARVDEHIVDLDWPKIDSPAVDAYLRGVKEPLEQAVSIWITDPTGTVRAGSQEFDAGVTHADRDFFRAQVDHDAGTFISAPFVGRATNISSFAISRRRSSPNGFDGIIHIAVSPDYFIRFFKEAAPPLNHAALLLRADGVTLAREPKREGPPDPVLDKPLQEHIASDPDGRPFFAVSPSDQRQRLYAYRHVGPYPLFVAFSVESGVLLQKWYRNLRIYGAVAGIASLVLLLVSLLALRRAQAEQAALNELRREVAQRETAEAQLRQAQKMEAVGQLTGGIAHDFNNLLSVIAGNADLMMHRGTTAEQTPLAEAILRAAERGAALTRQLLAFSRLQQLDVAMLDLNQRIREMKDMLGRSLRANITVETQLQPAVWPIEVDANQLELAVLNIAVNARDAMPMGGTLTIRTRNLSLDRPGLSGAFVALAIEDTGIGMTPEQSRRAFEPFFTTKEIGKGTGLGLSMVYGFVRQSGGSIEIESQPGIGTTVTLYLPKATSASRISPVKPEQQTMPPAGGDILIVEDDEAVGAVTAAFAEALGYRVRTVPSADEALELLAWDIPPQLMISDMYMPGAMGGLDLAHEARRRLPGLPILLVTGANEAAEQARASGFPVLMKPFRQTNLAEAIAMAMAQHPFTSMPSDVRAAGE
jgi:signal transduction histidine kinase/CheY-like chemotaxis protein